MTTEKKESPIEVIGRIFSRPKRVLLVDDDEKWTEIFRDRITPYNIDLLTVNRCAAARQELEEKKFDALILDVKLTNGTGVEIYREVAAKSPGTQVVFLTGYFTDAVKYCIEQIGPARVYSKDRLTDETFVDQLMRQLGAVRPS